MADKPPERPPDGLSSELERLDKAIAEMAAANVKLDRERNDIAGKMQLAQYRRDVLAHEIAEQERQRGAGSGRTGGAVRGSGTRAGGAARAAAERARTGTRRLPRQVPARTPPGPGGGPATAGPGSARAPADPAADSGRPQVQVAPLAPEASARSVQTIMLGLGALLLGIAAVVFVAVAITELDAASQLVILLAVTGLFLGSAPIVAARGLTATAETLSAIGLLVFSVAGYPLWSSEVVDWMPGPVFGGLVAAGTALVGYAYHKATRLDVPLWAALVATQPVLPLLVYPVVPGPAGWAVVFALVAAYDVGAVAAAAPGRHRFGYLAWALHAAALLLATGFALVALATAGTAPAAALAGLTLLLATGVGLGGALWSGRHPLPDLAAGLFTLAVIGSGSRVAALALPGRALLPVAAIATAVAVSCLLLPRQARRGPQRASAWALAALGVVVAGLAVRAGAATLVWPPWPADLAGYQRDLAAAAGTLQWQLVATAAAATVGAGLSLPLTWRREVTVAGAALTALAAPASLGLDPVAGAWVLAGTGAGLALTGLDARTWRAAASHVAGAGLVFLAATGTSLASPALTATVLAAITVTGAVVAGARPRVGAARNGAALAHPAGADVPTAEAPAAEAPAADAPTADAPAAAGAEATAAEAGGTEAGGTDTAGTRADRGAAGELVAEWAAGAATLALPGAATTAAVAAGAQTGGILAAGFAAACGSLSYAALTQLRQRHTPPPVRMGAALGTAVVAAVALGSAPTTADLGIAGLLLLAAGLVLATPRLDAIRRPDRPLDGADLAAAAVTAALVATLARISALALPLHSVDAGLATGAVLVVLVAVAVRAVPADWRRGPVLGVSVSGAVVAGVAAAAAVAAAGQALVAVSPLWDAELAGLPPLTALGGLGWSVPFALVLLAVAATVVLPRQASHRASATLAVLATAGAPVALGLDWWAPATLSIVAASGYALASVLRGPRAAVSRATAAGVLGAYAVCTSLGQEWTTAVVLGLVVVLGTGVAGLAPVTGRWARSGHPDPAGGWAVTLPVADPRVRIGGTAVATVLLAFPGMLAAATAHLGHGTGTGLLAALAGVSLGLAALAALSGLRSGPRPAPTVEPEPAVAGASPPDAATRVDTAAGPAVADEPARTAAAVAPYLPYGTVGVTAGATATALATLPTAHPTGVYAAAAVLLAVLSELVRAAAPVADHATAGRVSAAAGVPGRLRPVPALPGRISPPLGALAAAAVPAVLALLAIGPALTAALVDPYQALAAPWDGPPPALVDTEAVPATSVLAALLLTLAAALAAVGFGGAVTRQAAPVVAPGLAITVLIAPAALDAPWPAATAAALAVFTLAMLGVALTPPPAPAGANRPLRVTRQAVLGIGLAAGGAGLAGSLADPALTWATFGGAVAVGAAAALGGRTWLARLLGWLGAASAAQLFALVTAYLLGAGRTQYGFGLLAVGAVALLAVARLPRLRAPAAAPELAAVDGLGGYTSLLVALVLAAGSAADMSALLVGTGAVLGLAAIRPGRSARERRVLWVTGAVCEVAAWWILMVRFEVGLVEAYTLPFALFALLVGALEVRYRPELGSWVSYGPGLVAAFAPSLLLVVGTTDPQPGRQVWVILGGVAALLLGSRFGQRAPLIIGTAVTAVAALHLLSLAGPWLVLIPIGLLLLILGANREKRQRDLERLRGAYSRMR